jgi:hypothetical protein
VELYFYSTNTPSWRDVQLKKAQGQLYLYLLSENCRGCTKFFAGRNFPTPGLSCVLPVQVRLFTNETQKITGNRLQDVWKQGAEEKK